MVDDSGSSKGGRPGPGVPPRVLLVGYNGANNTGSESRLLSIIEDVRAVLGPEAHITVPTLNPVNLCRYVEETPHLHIAPVPSIYFFALTRLVKASDLVMLVEGSCYMDTWTTALLWAFLWSTKQAARHRRPSLAYAVDSGHLKPSNRERVRREASKTDLIITRTEAAAERLRSWGVTAPLEATADTTFTFEMALSDRGILGRLWPEAAEGAVGMALVDFYSWPVVVRPWGRSRDVYRWPYYFSRSPERRRATERLARGIAWEVDRIVAEHGRPVALICMEELDGPMAERVQALAERRDMVRVFSSCEYNASEMQGILLDLDLLVSSRYHACVMAMAGGVPMVAIGHDLRLEDLFRDMGIYKRNFIPHEAGGLLERLQGLVDGQLQRPGPLRREVLASHRDHVERARRNRELLRTFVAERGWSVVD